MKTRHQLTAYLGLLGMTVLIAILLSIRDRLIAIGPFVLGVLLALCGLILLYYLHKLYVQFRADRLRLIERVYEVEGKRQALTIEQERWAVERASLLLGQQIQTSRIYPDAKGYMPTLVHVAPEGYQYLQLPHPVHMARLTPPMISEQAESRQQEDEIPALIPTIPTFAEMLESGMVQAAIGQGKMILGFYAETHEPRFGSWFDLYSAGIGGVSGSGKSTTTRFLLFQAALAAARFLFVDPHIGDEEESLAAQFRALPGIHQMPPCNGQPGPVLKRVRWLSQELDRRKKAGIKGPPLILVIDEFNEQMRVKEVRDELSELLLNIEQGGRKFGIFALLLGQRWSAQDLGGADIRTSLASKMAHRFSDEDQAKKFIGSKYGKKLLELETGYWLFYDTKGKTSEMVTPETWAEDGEMIARLMVGNRTSRGTSRPAYTPSESASTPPLYLLPSKDTDVVEDALVEPVDVENDNLTPQALQVLYLLREKRGQNEIIEEIWGLKSSDGRPYRAAVEEYRVILATLASKIGA